MVGLRWPGTTALEDVPIRSLVAALALVLALPAAAAAHEPLDGSHWPTADELRRDLQDIGYEFEYDPAGRAFQPDFQGDWPAFWRLAEPGQTDAAAEAPGVDRFVLNLVDNGAEPVEVVFSLTTPDGVEGGTGPSSTVLMEIAARMPEEVGLDAAVWFMHNLALHPPGAAERTTLPCLVEEFDGGATLVWPLGDEEGSTGFYGTVGRFEQTPDEIEQCKAIQAQAGSTEEPVGLADDASADTGDTTAAEPVDYSVPPEEAVELIEAGNHTIIDVRTPAEYEQAHVVGALNIDVEAPDFGERISELDPEQPYLLYCRSGRRSDLAAQQMAAAGFPDIVDAAGLADLARAGAPIE